MNGAQTSGGFASPTPMGTLSDALGAAVRLMKASKETEDNLRRTREALTGEKLPESTSDRTLPEGSITQLHVVLLEAANYMEIAAHHAHMIQMAAGAAR